MIIKIILLTSLLFFNSYAKNLKIASYNVENLFDLIHDGTEYNEYIPNTNSNWNTKTYTKKLKNISKIINDLDADILALQEIESLKALKDLLKQIPQYKYFSFVKNKNSAIGVALISKFEILKTNKIKIKSDNKYARPIQEVIIKVDNLNLIIYNNHWPSKRASENERIEYAQSLQNHLSKHKQTQDYILLGDFNSNYNEFQTFIYDKKLNNTYGNTGINQVLNTTINKKYITEENILTFKKNVHYNLWLDTNYKKRFSYKYRGEDNTPDNILLSSALFDDKNISYVNNSFKIFKPNYLFENNTIKRWKTKGNKKKHLGAGFSDHLPIYALFSTNKVFKNKKPRINKSPNISSLYEIQNIDTKTKLYNVIVIYKDNLNAIIKQKNNRAMFVYKQGQDLKLGGVYDIEIGELKIYNGLKEIVKIDNIFVKNSFSNYKDLYLDARTIDILDLQYQNEIIRNLKAQYKKGYLHYKYKNKNKKIKLYAKDKTLLPKNGQKVNIISGHLGFYKSKPQIVIYKESDFSVN